MRRSHAGYPIIRVALLCAIVCSFSMAGCDSPLDRFEPNRIFAERLQREANVELADAVEEVSVILQDRFGTPDDPVLPEVVLNSKLADIVSVENLQRAAGAVRSDEAGLHYGLYREHCVTCHGVNGNGRGPAARLLNPYPRNFRMGVFKFKSTPSGAKPTSDDLHRLLAAGIPGTSMPSFQLIPSEDIAALVDYVAYLSIRGEVERRLLAEYAFELDIEGGESLVDFQLQKDDPDEFAVQIAYVDEVIEDVAKQWVDAEEQRSAVELPPDAPPVWPVEQRLSEAEESTKSGQNAFGEREAGPEPTQTLVPASPDERLGVQFASRQPSSDWQPNAELLASVGRGRELFRSQAAGCAFCHGENAAGDGQAYNYDDWTRDYTVMAGINPKDETEVDAMLELGALKPRVILPRNLRLGVFRGGGHPADLYRRIIHGIDGTPMPAVAMQPENPHGLTEEQVWDVINYLLSLPHEDSLGEQVGLQSDIVSEVDRGRDWTGGESSHWSLSSSGGEPASDAAVAFGKSWQLVSRDVLVKRNTCDGDALPNGYVGVGVSK